MDQGAAFTRSAWASSAPEEMLFVPCKPPVLAPEDLLAGVQPPAKPTLKHQGIGAAMASCAHAHARGKASRRSSPPRANDRWNHRCPPREQPHVHPRAPLMVRRSTSLASLRRCHRRQHQPPWRHRPCSPSARSATPSADLLPQAPFLSVPYLALPHPHNASCSPSFAAPPSASCMSRTRKEDRASCIDQASAWLLCLARRI